MADAVSEVSVQLAPPRGGSSLVLGLYTSVV